MSGLKRAVCLSYRGAHAAMMRWRGHGVARRPPSHVGESKSRPSQAMPGWAEHLSEEVGPWNSETGKANNAEKGSCTTRGNWSVEMTGGGKT